MGIATHYAERLIHAVDDGRTKPDEVLKAQRRLGREIVERHAALFETQQIVTDPDQLRVIERLLVGYENALQIVAPECIGEKCSVKVIRVWDWTKSRAPLCEVCRPT